MLTVNDLVQQKLEHIKNHPGEHHHKDLNALNRCCMVGGAIDTGLVDAHQRYAPVGRNGGQNCDVSDGPCSCGAWH